MNSRPAPGIQESLQRAGSGLPPRPPIRRQPSAQASASNNALIDLTVDGDRRFADDTQLKNRGLGTSQAGKPKPGSLESIQTAQDGPSRPPPRGKPQLAFNPRANEVGDASGLPPQTGHGTAISSGAANLPMPPRPGSSVHDDLAQAHRRIVPGGTGVKHDRNAKFAGFDPPAAAVVFPNGRTADFYPWNPQSPEDILTDALVKGGVNNKPSMINETNTARPSLWSNLKNKSGLQTLSTLLVAVLEKRQQCGRLTAPSTFKPPPRVTLTDSKRETWLRDLANPAIALRRLSRTIPHGIRGKLLLEQCLSKNIPIARAVWLAKCIGSNELRAFKRKGATGTVGMSAELKWNREWTIFVEQFVENTIASCGQPDWKARMDYATRLSSHLYSDRLLDQDHYLDWLLSSLDGSTLERLPIWLLMTQIYWQDLITSRRRGRRLAEALLGHANTLRLDPDNDVHRAMFGHLEKLIATLIMNKPSCLILPKIWDNRKEVVDDVVVKYPNSPIGRIAQDLDRRNERLSSIPQNPHTKFASPMTEIIAFLDSSERDISINVDNISAASLEKISDSQLLVSTILRWASSIYREGPRRIYLATRMIRKWHTLGIDTDAAIHSFLFTFKDNQPFKISNVFRVISELVRSKHFSVGRYLQWLIATGSTSGDQGPPDTWPSHLRLITELPLESLSDHVLNLRQTLLQGIGFEIETEEDSLTSAEDFIVHQIPSLFEWSPVTALPEDVEVSELSSSIQLSLGCLLRQQVSTRVGSTDLAQSKTPHDGPTSISNLTAPELYSIRDLVEKLGDYSILADILGMASSSYDYSVLAAVADTLHYHYKAFVAIGAFKPLFQRLASRYASLRTERPPERELFLSLADLARTAKADSQLLHLLRYDLGRCEPKNSLAACSPASDNMMDILQTTKMDTDDEINHILASGTSMDEQIMARVFQKITVQLDEHIRKDLTRSNTFVTWFYRLRSFDEKAFDRLMNDHLMNLLATHKGKLLLATLPTFMAAGCTTLAGFAEISKRCIFNVSQKEGTSAAKTSLVALNALLPSDELNWFCQIPDAYRYRLDQHRYCVDHSKDLLERIRQTVELCTSNASTEITPHFTSLLSSGRLLGILRQITVHECHVFAEAFKFGPETGSEDAALAVKTLLNALLDPDNTLELAQKSFEAQVSTIVQVADDFSLAFCQLQLRQIFEMNKLFAESSEDNVSAALLDAIKVAVDNDRSDWPDLIGGLDGNLTRKIREHAEGAILAAIGNPSRNGNSPISSNDDETFLRRYLTVVDFTAFNVVTEGLPNIILVLIEKLKSIVEFLNPSSGKSLDADGMSVDTSAHATSVTDICPWIHAVLHLAILHKHSFQNGKSSNTTQATFLWLLRTLFNHPLLQQHTSTTEYLFDVGAYFSDDITEDVRFVLAKADLAKPTQDPRSSFIFGSSPPPDCWLGLITPSSGASTGTTSTSQALQQPQHSYPSQPSQSPSPMPMHRSLSQQGLQKSSSSLQQSKGMPSLQRFATQHPQSPQQLQMQQFQQLAQQRSASASPMGNQSQNPPQTMFMGHGTTPVGSSGAGNFWSHANMQKGANTNTPQPSAQQQDRTEVRPMPFLLRRWEILPDPASVAGGNDTALSLGLFEARKV